MNLFKNVVAYKRKKTSNSPKTDNVDEKVADVDEKVVDDVHIDDIEEHQWVDAHPIGKILLCNVRNLHIFE